MKPIHCMLAGVLCLALANIASAQAVKQEKDLLPTEKFVGKAVECSTFEIKMAELAQKNAASPEVKELAKSIVDEHTKARKNLMEKFDKIGVVTGLDKEHQAEYDRVSKLEGKEFDQAYLKGVIERHQKAIEFCNTHSKAENASIKTFSQDCSKLMQDHLKRAQTVQKKLGGNN